MANKLELAQLCKIMYSKIWYIGEMHSLQVNRTQSHIWTCSTIASDRTNGFFAACFIRKNSAGSVIDKVIAFCGSNDLHDWLKNNSRIVAARFDPANPNHIPPQFQNAVDFVKKNSLSGDLCQNCMLTGHSLGGALALLAHLKTGIPVTTFNAPSITPACLILLTGTNNAAACSANISPQITNYSTKGDIVSKPKKIPTSQFYQDKNLEMQVGGIIEVDDKSIIDREKRNIGLCNSHYKENPFKRDLCEFGAYANSSFERHSIEYIISEELRISQ